MHTLLRLFCSRGLHGLVCQLVTAQQVSSNNAVGWRPTCGHASFALACCYRIVPVLVLQLQSTWGQLVEDQWSRTGQLHHVE